MTNIALSENAKKRILEIRNSENNKFLRLTVKSGGCSGFQYIFELDDKNLTDDVVVCAIDNKVENRFGNKTENNSEKNIIAKTDIVSMRFIEGSVIDFVEELGASYFKVINPNASVNCGCGASFGV